MTYQILGLSLFLVGLLHLNRQLVNPETRLVVLIQAGISRKRGQNLFQELWFLGRTPFAVLSLAFLACYDLKLGLTAGLVFLAAVGIEGLFKTLLKRPRPFISSREILMLQPREPSDPSFPSGDALRVFFLALTLPAAAGNPPSLLVAAVLVAVLVSLGRMVLGVHYLSDVLAGAGLGVLGAGTVIWLWNLLALL
jgi:membrane-associated phospholipid phosphatase